MGAIVTVTGSGPQDRDENIGLPGFRPFRQIADSLARRGIAALHRTSVTRAHSGGTFKGSTSADFAEDVRAGLAYLRTRPEIRADRLGVLGHSEGAIIAPMVAEKEPSLRAIVLLAGIAQPGRTALTFSSRLPDQLCKAPATNNNAGRRVDDDRRLARASAEVMSHLFAVAQQTESTRQLDYKLPRMPKQPPVLAAVSG